MTTLLTNSQTSLMRVPKHIHRTHPVFCRGGPWHSRENVFWVHRHWLSNSFIWKKNSFLVGFISIHWVVHSFETKNSFWQFLWEIPTPHLGDLSCLGWVDKLTNQMQASLAQMFRQIAVLREKKRFQIGHHWLWFIQLKQKFPFGKICEGFRHPTWEFVISRIGQQVNKSTVALKKKRNQICQHWLSGSIIRNKNFSFAKFARDSHTPLGRFVISGIDQQVNQSNASKQAQHQNCAAFKKWLPRAFFAKDSAKHANPPISFAPIQSQPNKTKIGQNHGQNQMWCVLCTLTKMKLPKAFEFAASCTNQAQKRVNLTWLHHNWHNQQHPHCSSQVQINAPTSPNAFLSKKASSQRRPSAEPAGLWITVSMGVQWSVGRPNPQHHKLAHIPKKHSKGTFQKNDKPKGKADTWCEHITALKVRRKIGQRQFAKGDEESWAHCSFACNLMHSAICEKSELEPSFRTQRPTENLFGKKTPRQKWQFKLVRLRQKWPFQLMKFWWPIAKLAQGIQLTKQNWPPKQRKAKSTTQKNSLTQPVCKIGARDSVEKTKLIVQAISLCICEIGCQKNFTSLRITSKLTWTSAQSIIFFSSHNLTTTEIATQQIQTSTMPFSPIPKPSTVHSTPEPILPTINVMELFPYVESQMLPHLSKIWKRCKHNNRLKSHTVLNIKQEHWNTVETNVQFILSATSFPKHNLWSGKMDQLLFGGVTPSFRTKTRSSNTITRTAAIQSILVPQQPNHQWQIKKEPTHLLLKSQKDPPHTRKDKLNSHGGIHLLVAVLACCNRPPFNQFSSDWSCFCFPKTTATRTKCCQNLSRRSVAFLEESFNCPPPKEPKACPTCHKSRHSTNLAPIEAIFASPGQSPQGPSAPKISTKLVAFLQSYSLILLQRTKLCFQNTICETMKWSPIVLGLHYRTCTASAHCVWAGMHCHGPFQKKSSHFKIVDDKIFEILQTLFGQHKWSFRQWQSVKQTLHFVSHLDFPKMNNSNMCSKIALNWPSAKNTLHFVSHLDFPKKNHLEHSAQK